ncbi:hypothetical protein NCCP2716_22580 [Sporosarcina sp. NCCP-2716]|uniref:hypothetical protein n=1 Tax=Sporosarcina sp. NCCP-2716 TaxID=2943679 RepID=UPI00203F3BA6|nr:hypothetical protein [Sporosarcina sp. NCCP-2716]GKV69760.1 hypothetical protein NCCP2716_22580 [Sporosarcina sp. NCCP-2716]
MELFLELAKEVLTGIARVVSARLFQKTLLNKKKDTRAVARIRVVSKTNYKF